MSAPRPRLHRSRRRRPRPTSRRPAPRRPALRRPRRPAPRGRPPRPAPLPPRRREPRTGPPREARRTAVLLPGPPLTRPPPGDLVRASPGRAPERAPADRPRHRRRASPRHAGHPAGPAALAPPAADRLRRLTSAVARRSAPAPVVPSPRRPEGLLDRPPAVRSRPRQGWAGGARPPGRGHRPAPAVPEEATAPPAPVPADRAASAAPDLALAMEAGAREGGWDAVPCPRRRPDEVVRADVDGLRSAGHVVAGATWRSSSRPS
jgi:hypothetical protein